MCVVCVVYHHLKTPVWVVLLPPLWLCMLALKLPFLGNKCHTVGLIVGDVVIGMLLLYYQGTDRLSRCKTYQNIVHNSA